MGLFDRLFGDQDAPRERPSTTPPPSEDERAIQRYRYLLETAPPEAIERVHAEAFEKLTPEQRRQVQGDLSAALPPDERPPSDDPRTMARAATRGELSNPGFLERTLDGDRGAGGAAGRGGTWGGPSFGSMVGSSLLGTVAGYVIGSALVSAFLPPMGFDGGAIDGSSGDGGADAGSADAGGADAGGDGGWGGDFGGGDFGGGDFGGDFGF